MEINTEINTEISEITHEVQTTFFGGGAARVDVTNRRMTLAQAIALVEAYIGHKLPASTYSLATKFANYEIISQ